MAPRDDRHTNALKLPASAPAATGSRLYTVCFPRAHAFQCESDAIYTFGATGEAAYFEPLVRDALRQAIKVLPSPPSLLRSFAEAVAIHLEQFQYHQLRLTKPTEVDGDSTCYTTYEKDGETFAINPEGRHYKVMNTKAWDWTFKLLATAELEDGGQPPLAPHAVEITVAKLPKDYASPEYAGPAGAKVLLLRYGQMLDGFVPTPRAQVYLSDKPLRERLTVYSNWTLPTEPGEADDEEAESATKHTFRVIGGVSCVWVKVNKDSGEWKTMGTFAITGIAAIHTFQDRDEIKYRLRCTQRGEGEGHLIASPEEPQTADFATLESDVLINLDKVTDYTLSHNFSKVHPKLLLEKWVKVEHISSLVISLKPEWPPVTHCVGYFGRQPTGVMVFGNCCYKDGRTYPLEESGYRVLPDAFTGENERIRITPERFPAIMRVEQAWVRYPFFVTLMDVIIPNGFLNNEMNAKAVLAISVMHLQSSSFWAGKGNGEMVYSGYLLGAPGNGKTEALKLANGVSGCFLKGINMGASSSLPACAKQCSLQADLCLCLDEIATKTELQKDTSKMLKDFTHLVANKNGRLKVGVEDIPRTGFIGTSNIMVNEKDAAFWERLILLRFDPFVATHLSASEGAEHDKEWNRAKQFVSCLQPDFEDLKWRGGLDHEAMTDWAVFLTQVTGGRMRSRTPTKWAYVGYYMLLLEAIAQSWDKVPALVAFVVRNVLYQEQLSTTHNAPIAQFVLAVHKVREHVSTNVLALDHTRIIHWHNYRTTERPSASPFHANVEFVALRLDSVCYALERVLGEGVWSKVEDVKRAIADDRSDCVFLGKGNFYNVSEFGWPIQKQLIDDDSGMAQSVPLLEHELLDATLARHACVYFKKTEWKRIVDCDLNGENPLPDFKGLVIESANKKQAPYNFYETICGEGPARWYGFRVLDNHAFAPYCGVTNRLNYPLQFDGGLEQLSIDQEQGSAYDVYNLTNFMQVYGYALPKDLPLLLDINPFVFENGPTHENMPNDERSISFYEGVQEAYEEEVAGRDDKLRTGHGVGSPTGSQSPAKRGVEEADTDPKRQRFDENVRTPGSNPGPNTAAHTPLLQAQPNGQMEEEPYTTKCFDCGDRISYTQQLCWLCTQIREEEQYAAEEWGAEGY